MWSRLKRLFKTGCYIQHLIYHSSFSHVLSCKVGPYFTIHEKWWTIKVKRPSLDRKEKKKYNTTHEEIWFTPFYEAMIYIFDCSCLFGVVILCSSSTLLSECLSPLQQNVPPPPPPPIIINQKFTQFMSLLMQMFLRSVIIWVDRGYYFIHFVLEK